MQADAETIMTSDAESVMTAQTDQQPLQGSEPWLGLFDTVVLAGIILVGAYWVLFRRKKGKDVPNTEVYTSFTMAPSTLPEMTSSSFIDKMKAAHRNVVVFYGSQTGTAEEFASRLAKESARYGMKGMVADPEECEMEQLPMLSEIKNSLAIFCMATYGEGDPTDNAQEFCNWLRAGEVNLSGMNYAVFGLGNKTYEHYNTVGKFVDKRLEELGGKRVFEIGIGDDDANLEEDFIAWKERFWPAVCEFFGIDTLEQDISMRQYRKVTPTETTAERVYTGEIARLNSYKNQRPPYDAKNPYLAPITVHRELHTGGDRSCMHIELDISESKIRYESGDHVAIFPTNDEHLVNKIGKLLDVDLDEVISLVSLDEDSHKKHPFPCPCSYRTALNHYLDITCIPYTHVLKEISDYAADPKEKEMLKLMGSSSAEGKKLYHEWVVDSCRNIVQILEDLPSLKPTLDHLCELLPRLQARYYSISSSPKAHPGRIHVTAVLVRYETPTKRINDGVATRYLNTKRPVEGSRVTVPMYVRKSQFRLPAQPQTPVVMIGPGTGLAPFRGFIQERHFQKNQGKPIGNTIIYFGCRKKSEDFLYGEELANYVKEGVLTKLYTAFSRDQDKKVYVTHLLKENGAELWDVIGNHHGHLYVCGDARNMARDVMAIVKEVCIEKGNMNETQAAEFIKKMEFQKRYSADVWS